MTPETLDPILPEPVLLAPSGNVDERTLRSFPNICLQRLLWSLCETAAWPNNSHTRPREKDATGEE